MTAEPVGLPPFVVVWGDDDFAVKRRARQVFQEWTAQAPGGDEEILDAGAANSDEARKALARLNEALQTLPFFGGSKTVWFRDCNFLGEDRVSESAAVVEGVAALGKALATFRWEGVRLLISAGRMDRRRSFFKNLDKLAATEYFPALSMEDRDWRDRAETLAAGEFRSLGKRVSGDALAAFVEQIGAQARQLSSEALKVATYAGDRPEVTLADVETMVTRGRHARAFALADAFGDRDLPRVLRRLEEELWSMQSDRQKSEIGLLYGLISKVRTMLLAKELLREGLIKPANDYRAFTAQLASLKALPSGRFPVDRRYNPTDINGYVLFRSALHCRNFSAQELVHAMTELLRCNRQLVGSSLEGAMVLQLALVRLLGGGSGEASSPGRGGGQPEGRRTRARAS